MTASSVSERLALRKPKTHFGRMTRRLLIYVAAIFFIFGPLSSLILWSLAEKWFWPHPFPTDWGFKYWHQVFEGKMLSSLGLSFAIAIAVTVLCLVLTVPFILFDCSQPTSVQACDSTAVLLPQAFPQLPVFTNVMVFMYRFDLVGTLTGLTLIHLVGAIVFSVWTLVSVFQSVAESMEEASYMLGGEKYILFPRSSANGGSWYYCWITSSFLIFIG